ncbi:MAG: ATP-binding cassette domain-containing protein [Synergistaceae bacterium]|jgi:D-methionine transport system ATP-binding protein|nr:ATP-binding cassette domain-containing protein [Synergistaceae bacterium]
MADSDDDAFITITGLKKTFRSSGRQFEVLRNVNLAIGRGDIFGVVGFSGAGKSTLIRCINRLEEPDEGKIKIGGTEVTNLTKDALGRYRQKIGVIFQQFNLLDSRTVAENVSFPLEIAGMKRAGISGRVREILELVDLSGKADFYPGQLSGGQKQRVGIARALANNPDILLSDEATSALDPQTTLSVLDLLKDINVKLKLTIILITHELNVIRYICKNMAVLEDGQIVEDGPVKNIFNSPKSDTARLFMKIDAGFANFGWEGGGGI